MTRHLLPPPAGSPWDLPVSEAPLAFVDLEMTGLDADRDRVVEICVERWVGEVRVDALDSLVQPSDARVGGAAHVHGIGEAELVGAPAFSTLADRVLGLLDGAVFVAHAAEWDIKFLGAEMARCGRAFDVPHYLDTLTLSRRSFALPSHSLDALCTHFVLDRGRAHRASDDVRAMRSVFAKCVAALAPVSARDLWEVRIAARRARAAIVLQCEAAVNYGTPVTVTYRPARRGPEPLQMVLTEVRASLDPPRVLGYLLPGRGRRELRADRILKVESS